MQNPPEQQSPSKAHDSPTLAQVVGAGPTPKHRPSRHCVPQAMPQEPQLLRSVLVSTQAVPHGVCPAAHSVHFPPEQIAPGQALPQTPQLPGSVEKSLQMP